MKNKEYINLAEKTVDYAVKKGADEVQVKIDSREEFEAGVLNQEIENLHQAGDRELSLKVIIDKKVATASSNDFSDETLRGLIDNAVKRAELSGSDPFSGLPKKEDIKVEPETLKLFDPKITELSPEEKIKFAKKLEKIGLAIDKIKVSSGSSYATIIGNRILANSKGFSGSYDYTMCYAGVGFQAGEGDNLVEEHWSDFSRHLDDFDTAENIADTAVHRVTRLIGSRKIKTQQAPIIFEPKMTASILGFLSGCLSGKSIYMNRSFLTDELGEKIGNDKLTVIDDGTMPKKLGSKPFDSEGVPTRRNVIIENGVLKNYLLDVYSARKLDMKPTGNASGPNNFYLKAGEHSPEDIIKSVDRGLLLTGTIGQGTMPTTGGISKGAFGLWIENGEIAFPVSEITFSANLGDMLKNISMIGNDLEFRRAIAGPTVRIDDITLSGK